jgi:chromosome segregation ATPase
LVKTSLTTELGKIPKLAKHMGLGQAIKVKGGQLLTGFLSTVSGKIMAVTAAVLLLKGAWDKVNKACGITLKAQIEKAEEARKKYSDVANEVTNIENEIESYRSKLQEIGDNNDVVFDSVDDLDSMIDTLNRKDISLVEQAEVDKIEAANTRLQSQLDLKNQIAQAEASNAAYQALNAAYRNSYENTGESVATGRASSKEVGGFMAADSEFGGSKYQRTNLLEAAEGSVEHLQQLKTQLLTAISICPTQA